MSLQLGWVKSVLKGGQGGLALAEVVAVRGRGGLMAGSGFHEPALSFHRQDSL